MPIQKLAKVGEQAGDRKNTCKLNMRGGDDGHLLVTVEIEGLDVKDENAPLSPGPSNA